MKNKKLLLMLVALIGMGTLVGCKKKQKQDEYEDGKLKISIRNLYFDNWVGDDQYLREIEDQFNVKLSVSAYSYNNWNDQVSSAVNGDNLPDSFDFNLDSYNIQNTYRKWAEDGMIKPLPSDMSQWPLIDSYIKKCDNYEKLLIDGKLYCIPVLKDFANYQKDFSPFTYVYRRDWAKQWGVYQENDVYTWEQFIALLDKFYVELTPTKRSAIADVEWGYPSIINFYKDFPHIFGYNEANNTVFNNYTSEKFLAGLELAKEYSDGAKKYYAIDQYNYVDREGEIISEYEGNKVGVFYENLSLKNYTNLRAEVLKNNKTFTPQQLDDATAIMKVKGPDGKFALEGAQNWFSATFFSADVSDNKLSKILDVLEWTLTDEGTIMALYGDEGYDYVIDDEDYNYEVGDSKVKLIELPGYGWEKTVEGKYPKKDIAARYLRNLVTLSYDLEGQDPMTDQGAYAALSAWETEMKQAKANGLLRVIKENPDVEWSNSSSKNKNSSKMLKDGNTSVISYCYGNTKSYSKQNYLDSFNTQIWTKCLNEMNAELAR